MPTYGSPLAVKNPKYAKLGIIYETDNQRKSPIESDQLDSIKLQLENKASSNTTGFKENMLLSFYNWPKIETSTVGASQKVTKPPVAAPHKRDKVGRYEQKRTSQCLNDEFVHNSNEVQNTVESLPYQAEIYHIQSIK